MTYQQPSYEYSDVEVVKRSTVWRNFFQVDRLRLKHRLFAGGWSETFERELVMRPPSAGVLLYDPLLQAVVMVEQFRVGALAGNTWKGVSGLPHSPWLLELVAGIVEEGESAEENVRREAVEEAGCAISDLLPIADYFNSPGGADERVTLLCGRVDASAAGGDYGVKHEHEDIRVHVLSVEAAWQALQAGRINNAMAVIALQWLHINQKSVREQWLL